jgi:hypothetical protein
MRVTKTALRAAAMIRKVRSQGAVESFVITGNSLGRDDG